MNTGQELRLIIERLQNLDGSSGFWEGDLEAERRHNIDLQSGHALARQALRRASAGLDLWDHGLCDGAAVALDEVLGIMAYLRRSGVDLSKPPTYGRSSSDRNARLARLVDAKREETGQTIAVCIDAVMLENNDLARLFATRNPASLKKAYQRGQKA